MPRVFPAAALLALAACSPDYNWRELTVQPVALHAMFPCKPDKAERKMPLTREREVVVHAVGCETGGAAYAVLWTEPGSPAEMAGTMAQWKQASLASLQARVDGEAPFVPRGALALPQSVQVWSTGRRPGGASLQNQSAYFARGNTLFQAVVYAPTLKPEMTESFFAGLRFE